MSRHTVTIQHETTVGYAAKAPYHPSQHFPELQFVRHLDPSNSVYGAVRSAFHLLGYDAEHYGSPQWDPLGWLVRPGETVFIKPNMIAEKHLENDDWDYVITHGSVIRAVVDYVYIALKGKGKVIIGDGPQTDSDFERIVLLMGLESIKHLYSDAKELDIEIVDLRDERWIQKDGVYLDTVQLKGDPRGKAVFNLGSRSLFSDLDGQGKQYYGAFYDSAETNRHHSGGLHEYTFSASPLAADVFINIPKLKTHKKCGLTVNLKSLVGLNANKNWLPHYIFGSPESGGDQFPEATATRTLENTLVVNAKKVLLKKNPALQKIARLAKEKAYGIFGGNDRVVRSGNWHGNQTVWRMALDLNRILMYGRPDGSFGVTPKRYFSVVDGIRAMEGNGPVAGTPKEVGILIAGPNPVAVDLVCATLMGFDYRKIPIIARAFDEHDLSLAGVSASDIVGTSNNPEWNRPVGQWARQSLLDFEPHFGWKGHIELER